MPTTLSNMLPEQGYHMPSIELRKTPSLKGADQLVTSASLGLEAKG